MKKGSKHTLKTIFKMKKRIAWNKGIPWSEKIKRKISKHRKGFKMPEETKEKIRQTFKRLGIKPPPSYGKKHWNWKGGKWKTSAGYIYVLKPKHPFANKEKYVLKHRLVMEKHLKRFLKPSERVHHLNGIKNNNYIKNLKLFSNESEHQKFHQFMIHEI